MKNLLFLAVVILLQSCSVIGIEHREGNLPKIKINGAEEICTEKLKAEIKTDKFLIECRVKL